MIRELSLTAPYSSHVYTQRQDHVKMWEGSCLQTRKRALTRNWTLLEPDLGLSAFKSVTIIFLFSKPPSLWYFVWWLEHSNTYKLFRWALNTITGILQEGAEGDFRLTGKKGIWRQRRKRFEDAGLKDWSGRATGQGMLAAREAGWEHILPQSLELEHGSVEP